jgi:mannose-6-phosphate isomerase
MAIADHIFQMDNPIQTYAWGSRTAIADLMGQKSPSAQPQAEIWMGAHPKAPSKVWCEERWQPLDQLISQYPVEMLGAKVAHRFDSTLPYLFKVLAIGQPLSIQAHPDKKQAIEGFRRENLENIDLDAPNRNYKDQHHKPECICALTPFWGACGFRTLPEMIALLGPVWPLPYNHVLTTLSRSFNPKGLRLLFQQLMHMKDKERKEMVALLVENALKLKENNIAYDWIVRLNDRYPGDVGVLSPLLLNLIQLDPGEAIFLPSKQLHAYLDGLGIELMANSDNVLRGGLTPKYVDVDELMAILDFNPQRPDKLAYRVEKGAEKSFHSPAEEFALCELSTTDSAPCQSGNRRKGAEIVLCVEGSAVIKKLTSKDEIIIEQGRSVFVPACVTGYSIQGNARLFKASVNV